MNFKSKEKTKLTSIRLEENLINECKRRGINISFACNLFLKFYLYIQKYHSDECPLIGTDSFKLSDLVIRVYTRH